MMPIRAFALFALISSTAAFAHEAPFARVRNYGQEYTGFEYRVNTETGQGSVLLGFRELVDMPGSCQPHPDCPPVWRYRYSSQRASVPHLYFDSVAQRIVYANPSTGQSTVCATTEERRRRGNLVLYIHPTGDCGVKVSRDRQTFEFYFQGK